jgi:LPXTG-motif cell wall-anchored protein
MEPAADSGKHLPKTASRLPLVGLLGLTSLLAGAGLTLRRRLAR